MERHEAAKTSRVCNMANRLLEAGSWDSIGPGEPPEVPATALAEPPGCADGFPTLRTIAIAASGVCEMLTAWGSLRVSPPT